MLDKLAEFTASQQSRLQSKQVCYGMLSATLPEARTPVLDTWCCRPQGGPGHSGQWATKVADRN